MIKLPYNFIEFSNVKATNENNNTSNNDINNNNNNNSKVVFKTFSWRSFILFDTGGKFLLLKMQFS